jgi:hypothetical protein
MVNVEAWDGVVDPGIEQREPEPTTTTSTEIVAHALLRLAAERPGHMGRERAARVVGGYAVAYRDDEERIAYEPYIVARDWKRRELVELVDALIDGGLMAQSVGPRPLLVLTRAGHHALNALEGTT